MHMHLHTRTHALSHAHLHARTLTKGHSIGMSRPGIYAWDRSYWQLYLSFCGQWQSCPPNALNVSLEWTSAPASSSLGLIATVVNGNGANVSDYVLTVSGTFAWGRTGSIDVENGGAGITLAADGQCPHLLCFWSTRANINDGSPRPPNMGGSAHPISVLSSR